MCVRLWRFGSVMSGEMGGSLSTVNVEIYNLVLMLIRGAMFVIVLEEV